MTGEEVLIGRLGARMIWRLLVVSLYLVVVFAVSRLEHRVQELEHRLSIQQERIALLEGRPSQTIYGVLSGEDNQ